MIRLSLEPFVLAVAFALAMPVACSATAQDKPAEFSGPQVGEKLTPFTAQGVLGDSAGKEFDLVASAAGKPVVIVFVHEANRPSIGLARIVGSYAASKKASGLTSGLIFLSADATTTEAFIQRAAGALPQGLPVGISTDGQEGPGAYGLNRKVQMTILIGKENKVAANFALVQPSAQADAPKIIQAIAEATGIEPPTKEELQRLVAPPRR
ncbi:MAG: hypothetical protein WD872_13845 [Pirellulaceae bacterium]